MQYSGLLKELEDRIARLIGTEYAIVTSSGRAALKIALLSLGVDRGNVIIPNLLCPVVPETIISSAFKPFVVDINEDLSMDLGCLYRNRSSENKVIMPVYLYGCPVENINNILEFAKDNRLFVVEDAAQSFGARISGRCVGSFGDVGIFSLSKVFFGLLRGGVITTNNEEIAGKATKHRAKIQTNETERINMLIRYTRGNMPSSIKWLWHKWHVGARQNLANFSSYDTSDDYSHLDHTYLYHYQSLMRIELETCLRRLEQREKLIENRLRIVKDIFQVASKRGDLETLFPYNPDFGYCMVPTIVTGKKLSAWLGYLYQNRILVDMIYRPLSRNMYFHDKCVFPQDYPISEYMSKQLLPLPVDARLTSILKNAT